MDLFVDKYSEAWRKECEARWVLDKTLQMRREYLANVEDKRGKQARLELEQEIYRLWKSKRSSKA